MSISLDTRLRRILDGAKEKCAELDRLVDQIPPEFCLDLLEPGGWTLKDITAHVIWFERKVIICSF